ncbi:hypothetical protein EFY79_18545 [Hanamia caeni]|uniref:Uncharacterized protein n=1 Tax=Hanamia caeni TaxID=2294116 RepID=A0A3M9N743_9BACT|nr:hypothetical protein [Hanamia caeni]RNI33620.1 hypothetical protein EFY79_18545 [Hanamia caeni]
MNYDIKIRGAKEDNGYLEFDRLNLITQSTKEIATKALMLRLRGFSDIKPDSKLKAALFLRLESLSGNKLEGTSMLIDCDHFEETIKKLQLDFFRPTQEILKLTPMALVIQSFRSALLENEDKDYLDKPLLKSLLKFKKNFASDNEVFFFSNRNSIPEIEVTREDFKKIEVLEESIPEPRKIIINGQLDEMKVSKNRLGLLTKEGVVNIFANDNSIIHGIVNYMGKEVTISGIANYRPGGQLSYIEIEQYFEPGKSDDFFSRKPKAMTVEQQVLFQLKQGKKKNPLSDLIGKWPGDESFDDLLKMLDE